MARKREGLVKRQWRGCVSQIGVLPPCCRFIFPIGKGTPKTKERIVTDALKRVASYQKLPSNLTESYKNRAAL